MIQISQSVMVARPIDDVFRYVCDEYFEHATKWNPATVQLKKTAPGPVGIGTTGFEVQNIKGKSYERHFAVREWERNKRFAFVTVQSQFEKNYRCEFRFEPAGSGTRITVDVEIEIDTPMFRYLKPVAERTIRKDLETQVTTLLKSAIERSLNQLKPSHVLV